MSRATPEVASDLRRLRKDGIRREKIRRMLEAQAPVLRSEKQIMIDAADAISGRIESAMETVRRLVQLRSALRGYAKEIEEYGSLSEAATQKWKQTTTPTNNTQP